MIPKKGRLGIVFTLTILLKSLEVQENAAFSRSPTLWWSERIQNKMLMMMLWGCTTQNAEHCRNPFQKSPLTNYQPLQGFVWIVFLHCSTVFYTFLQNLRLIDHHPPRVFMAISWGIFHYKSVTRCINHIRFSHVHPSRVYQRPYHVLKFQYSTVESFNILFWW